MNPQSQRPLPPVFSSEQEQNKAECAAIWYNYGAESEQHGDLLGARMGFMCAWREQAEERRYFQTLVNFLDRNGFIDELFKVYEIGVQLFRDHVPTFVNYSSLLNEYGAFEQGRESAEAALMMDPHCLPAWGNLGNSFRGIGEFEKAASCFEKILKDDAENALAGFNLASVFLAQGDYERGFYYYDHRLNLPGYERLSRRNNAPIWSEEFLEGATVLVYAEQGLGDTLMFSRYLPLLLELGASKVYFEVQAPLFWMFETLNSDKIEVLSRRSLDEPLLLETDFQLPLLSLPHIALIERSTLETDVPYLSIRESDAGRALEKIQGIRERNRKLVGVCWQGNPNASVDQGRSLDLAMLTAFFENKSIDFVSLQARDGLEEVDAISKAFDNFHYLHTLDGDTRAFEETIVLIRNVDLVITSDTAIAHLAGALGKPTWLLLQKYPEWRWGMKGEHSHWYPQMKLFRQEQAGEWMPVVREVVRSLSKY